MPVKEHGKKKKKKKKEKKKKQKKKGVIRVSAVQCLVYIFVAAHAHVRGWQKKKNKTRDGSSRVKRVNSLFPFLSHLDQLVFVVIFGEPLASAEGPVGPQPLQLFLEI